MRKLDRRRDVLALMSLLALALLPLSCRQFFSTSLASWAARDSSALVPDITTDNIDELLALSASDPEMALAVLEGIEDAIAGADADEQAELQAAALVAASSASGVGPAILENAGDVLETLDSGEDTVIIDMVAEAIGGLDQLADTSTALLAILPDPATEPAAFVAEASAEDLAMAAVVLLAAEAQAAPDVGTYIDTYTPVQDTLAVELAEAAAAAYAAEGGTGPLADILASLNLTP